MNHLDTLSHHVLFIHFLSSQALNLVERDGLPEWQAVPFEATLAQQTFVTTYPDCFGCLLKGEETNFGKYKLVNLNSVGSEPVYLCDIHYTPLWNSKYIALTLHLRPLARYSHICGWSEN